jgi:hypothetical protein
MADPVTASLGLAGASTLLNLKAAKDEHKANQAQMARRKAELERNAVTAKAISQQKGFEEERKAKLVMSRARALAAFSGAGADDKTVMDIIGDIESEGVYRRDIALYKGKEEARRLLEGAAATEEAMRAEKKAYKTRQITNVLNFGSSMFGMAGRPSGGGAPAFDWQDTGGWDESWGFD